MRTELRRWWILLYFCTVLGVGGWHSYMRHRHRRRALRQMEALPW